MPEQAPSEKAKPAVGFIGLGIMGAPMARNLLRAGYPLIVHNRTPAKAQALAQDGARIADSPREVAELSEIAITMLPDSPDVEQVWLGEQGLLEGARAGALLIDMSSVDPAVAQEVSRRAAALGAQALDAPVSGGDVGAAQGTLSIMVGGPEEAFRRALPLLECLGTTIVHVGETGAGQVTKACNQVLVALTIGAVAEALVLGSKAGVDPERLVEVFSGGLAASRVLELRSGNMLAHDFRPGFRARLHHKDLRNALQTAERLGMPLPATADADEILQELIACGYGDEDHSAMVRIVERHALHRIGQATSDETPPQE